MDWGLDPVAAKTFVFRGIFLLGLAGGGLPAMSFAENRMPEEAYEHNRQGMIAMSMARFEEAIESFQKASALALDYEIRGEKLQYTPVFHTGWASEKTGDQKRACEAFRKFLEIAPPDFAEATKIEHAQTFTGKNCRLENVH